MDDKRRLLKRYFGYDEFRAGQEQLVDALVSRRDVLGVMPTGGGKSLCYQLPALLLGGVAIVVSPLISLMKDQVAALKSVGIKAAYINSSLSYDEIRYVCFNVSQGAYSLVYVAPERLENRLFIDSIAAAGVSLIAVDEAHCISQWGQDFRPSYLKIRDFIAKFKVRPPIAAFTATATRRVREDIVSTLKLRDPLEVVTGFDRPNLRFEVLRPTKKSDALVSLIKERAGQSGIVYCSTRKTVESVCSQLCDAGVSATRYHAGLADEERRKNQDDFIYDRRRVMVATNAFGMGIDKSNVTFVIHYNMPQSIESYYQEAGRAGRDGSAADCILLYSPADVITARTLILSPSDAQALPPEERGEVVKHDLERLNQMVAYCRTSECLRGCILDYFGEKHAEQCGNCSNCSTEFTERDITRESMMILSCVKRISDRLGYPLGKSALVLVLRGSADKKILGAGLDKLSTYGLLKDVPRGEVSEMIEALEQQGYLHVSQQHGGVSLTASARRVLFGGERVHMRVAANRPSAAESGAPSAVQADGGLFEALRKLRFKIATEEKVPAYIVFTNATLTALAAARPKSMTELLNLPGMGLSKVERYGERLLAEIARYLAEQSSDE